MAKEIERRFLMGDSPIPIPDHHNKFLIKQGYVYVGKDKQVRVRLIKDYNKISAALCVKYTAKLVRDEYEFRINELIEAKELYKKCKLTIEKKRLSFNSGQEHYDVDIFPNELTVVEVEFKSLKNMKKWVKPRWVGKEITGVRKYSNISLAKKNLKFKK